jgi:TorA maturation chaperone TorD
MQRLDPTFQEDLSARRDVYALLARLFGREVDGELLGALREGGVLAGEDYDNGALSLMRGYLAGEGASVLDLARDYAKTFCGAGSTKMDAAYPFESVYTSENHMLMQEARDGALAWYHRFGLGKNESWHDCEDHLGLELEFMAYLVGSCLEAAEAHDDVRAAELMAAQRDFAREHLANWLPEFARDADRKARTDFYRGLVRLASRYVDDDLAALESALAA